MDLVPASAVIPPGAATHVGELRAAVNALQMIISYPPRLSSSLPGSASGVRALSQCLRAHPWILSALLVDQSAAEQDCTCRA